jgi:uncharacterized protein YceH (UPF0502 family)
MEPLNPVETRVLGALVEKDLTTPDYYPLSLNALTNACNQSSNRDPVVSFSEEAVVRGLDSLRERSSHSCSRARTAGFRGMATVSWSFLASIGLGRRSFASFS